MATTTYAYPNGPGSKAEFTIFGTAAFPYAAVNSPNGSPDDTNGLKRLNSTGANHFTITPFTVPSDAFNIIITLYLRASRTATGAASIGVRLIIDGGQQTVHTFSMTTSIVDYSWPVSVHPITLGNWTPEQVNNMAVSGNLEGIGMVGSGLASGEEVDTYELHVSETHDVPTPGATATVPMITYYSDMNLNRG